MQSSIEPIVFSSKSTAGLPFIVLVVAISIIIGLILIVRSLKVSGHFPILPVLGLVAILLISFLLWKKMGERAGSITVYPDQIVTSAETIRLTEVSAIYVDTEGGTAYVSGRPVPTARKRLLVQTPNGVKVVATDDLFDIDAIQNAIQRNEQELSH